MGVRCAGRVRINFAREILSSVIFSEALVADRLSYS